MPKIQIVSFRGERPWCRGRLIKNKNKKKTTLGAFILLDVTVRRPRPFVSSLVLQTDATKYGKWGV